MKRYLKLAMTAALPFIGAAGCGGYLEGGELSVDPNRPTEATLGQRFIAVQQRLFINQTSDAARLSSLYTQQTAGTDRQYLALGLYTQTEGTLDGYFSTTYSNGGLVDIRRLQTEARAINDRFLLGVAQVMEGYTIGMAASLFGDIPYSEAVNDSILTPKLDDQLAVYDRVQGVLDSAILNVASNVGNGPPGSSDLVYARNRTKWTQLANTLKARFYMHTAEVRGAAAYTAARAAAARGISTPANNYTAPFAGSVGSENPYYQFTVVQRSGYLSPGAFFVELLKSRSDPRLAQYFAPNSAGQFRGAAPGEETSAALSDFSDAFLAPGADIPLVTFAENQLILAEAAQKLGDDAAALAALNAVRAVPVAGRARAPVAFVGTPLLEEILTEKYISLFPSIETYNDYKRNCFPRITPAGSTGVPGRFLYGFTERNTNPNIPGPGQQPARNKNDPNACS